MISNVNWLFAEATAELRDVGHGDVVQSPKRVFVERRMSLLETNFDAICQQVILPDEVLFLHPVEKVAIITFRDDHRQKKKPGKTGLLPFFS